MRIALVSETWLPSVDGVVTRLRHTVHNLRDRGHEVLVLAPRTGPPIAGVGQVRLPGMVVPFVDRRRRVGLPLSRPLIDALELFGPDLVHVVNPVLMGWAAVRMARQRYPTVVSFHTDLEAYAGRYHLGILRPTLRSVMHAAYRSADLALATSPTGQQRLAALGVPARLWPPGVDVSIFGAQPRIAPPPAWLTPEPTLPTAVCVGRLAPEKNLVALVPALAASRRGPRPWHLTFIGDGPDRDRVRRRFAGLPVTFTGTLAGPELALAYSSADVLLMPSVTETVGLVLLEATASGLPVVAADTPAARHTLRGRTATFVAPDCSPADWVAAINGVLGRPRPAPAAVQSWSAVTDGLVEAYRQVAASLPRARRRPAGIPTRGPFARSGARTARRSCGEGS